MGLKKKYFSEERTPYGFREHREGHKWYNVSLVWLIIPYARKKTNWESNQEEYNRWKDKDFLGLAQWLCKDIDFPDRVVWFIYRWGL